MRLTDYRAKGWLKFPAEPSMISWAAAAKGPAQAAAGDPANDRWWRCGGTWFVGVDALLNDEDGVVAGGPPLSGSTIDFIRNELGRPHVASHRGQISICYPGYPSKDVEESSAAHAYRVNRDSAHVDGLHGEGPSKHRHLRELHDFILGIPLDDVDEGAAPFVIWEGSHEIIRNAFRQAYAGHAPAAWGELDVTAIYQAARKTVFETCERVEVTAGAGECYLAHRLSLHGVAPWRGSPQPSRTVIYFRPCFMSPLDWLDSP